MSTSLGILLLAASVSACNVALNIFASKAGNAARTWPSIFSSNEFAIAFVIGLASLGFMLTLYHVGRGDKFGMANGVLLMGALSIICGTLYGYYNDDNIHWPEWVIFALILIFVVVRYLIKTDRIL